MAEANTGKTVEQKETLTEEPKEVKVEETKQPESKPAGEPTPSKKDEQAKEPEVKEQPKKTPATAQQRIDRMYARMKKEQAAHSETRDKLDKFKTNTPAEEPTPTYDDEQSTVPPAVTDVDIDNRVEQALARKEAMGQFKQSETDVLLRHETALNEDGSYNLEDPFTKAYIDIGRENPFLLNVPNGPEIAETMAEKRLGLSYKKGRHDESSQRARAEGAHTGVSSTKVSPTQDYNLSDEEKKIARKTGMTAKEYSTYKAKRDSGDTRV